MLLNALFLMERVDEGTTEDDFKWSTEETPPVTLPEHRNHSGTSAGSLLSISTEHVQVTRLKLN